MPAIDPSTIILGGTNPVGNNVSALPTHDAINARISMNEEKIALGIDDKEIGKDGAIVDDAEITTAPPQFDADDYEEKEGSEDVIIITGADAAQHLLPIRDDREPALTFRSLFLATILSAFQAVMNQIYNVS
jgi:hypothetical protein